MTNVVHFPRKNISSDVLKSMSDRQSLADTSNDDESTHRNLNESLLQLNQETQKITELIKLLSMQLKRCTVAEDLG